MNAESVTIVRAHRRRLAKLIQPDGDIKGYDKAKTVDLVAQPIADLAALHRLLLRLKARQDCALIRGAPADPERTRGVRRLLYDDRKTGECATLCDLPRHWLALDLDSLSAPSDLDLTDLAACATIARASLPPAFDGAALIVQATASHTLKPGLRLRLWCWLSRPTAGAELKRWFADYPVDRSVFGAVQPIYTAGPLFVDRPDPLPCRLALLPGGVVTAPSPDSLTPPPKAVSAPLAPSEVAADCYTRRALENAVARILGATARHPAILSEARGLHRLVAAGLLMQNDLRRTIHAAAAAVGKNDPDEIDKILAWVADHPTGTTPEVRHHAR